MRAPWVSLQGGSVPEKNLSQRLNPGPVKAGPQWRGLQGAASRASLPDAREAGQGRNAETTTSLPRILADLFPGRERWLLAGVLAMGLVSALFETLGVASILPFMALVLDPSAVERYPALSRIGRLAGAASSREMLLLVGAATVVIVALGNAAAAANVVVQERFAARTRSRLAAALFGGYLRQPYAFHVQRDAPSLMKIVLNDVRVVVATVVAPLLLAASKALMAMGMMALLFLQDPVVAFTIAAVLGAAYSVVFWMVRTRQRRLGSELNAHNLDRQRIAQEGLGGIKELQVLGHERHTVERFETVTHGANMTEASNRITSQLPRYVLETVAFGGILLATLVLLAGAEDLARSVVPVLALYAFAGYRLLPALQQIFASAVHIRFYLPVTHGLRDDYVSVAAASTASRGEAPVQSPELHFTDAIRLDKVSFTYLGAAAPALHDVNLVIRPKESVGLVGRTGSGKTTLADMLLGLYQPSEGILTVDGVPLAGPAIRAWRRRVGYVPQHVFLANASVAENIAFGLPPSAIDAEAVRRAARLAQAEEFIRELPRGFDTLVGERGVKLSGGQRQRIGIARALYYEPEVLVFDEATSALDGLTEEAVMEAIRSLSGQRTIILIAHRLRTVEACDRIVLLENGRVLAAGSYGELLETSGDFRRLVGRTHARSLEAAE